MNITKILRYAEFYQHSCPTISKNMQYHLDNNLTMDKIILRPGSDGFANLIEEYRSLSDNGSYTPNDEEKYYLGTDLGRWGEYNGNRVPLDLPMIDGEEDNDIGDAKYQGKEVELNEPKRGGSKKFYVYVKDGDNVKKISFGSPDMDMNISDPGARKSFKARHKCESKNDKTTPGYWACRIARYPNITGAKKKYTWW